MNRLTSAALGAAVMSPLALTLMTTTATAQVVPLGTVAGFAILAGETITNTGPTVINGDVGLDPGTAIVGFGGAPDGLVNGTIHADDAVAEQAKVDLVTTYNDLAGRPTTIDLTGQDLGGQVLTAGVYNFADEAEINGTLTLDAEGNPNAVFIVNIGSTLTTGSGSDVVLLNGAQAGNVFFRVGSSASLGATTTFNGQIVALTTITLDDAANIACGAVWARNGEVTLINNTITVCPLIPATVGDVIGPDVTENQQAIADAIDALIAGDALPMDIEVLLAFLSPEELAEVLAQLAGETATGVAPTATGAMDSFMSLVLNPYRDRGVPVLPPTQPAVPIDNTVMVMGYSSTPASSHASAAIGRMATLGATAFRTGRYVWATGYGGFGNTEGDPAVGSHDRFTQNFGFAVGIDNYLSPNAMVGFAVGLGATGFSLSDGFGGGRGLVAQTAIHGRMDFGAAYVAGALAYAWHAVTTDRTVTALGVTELTAAYSAHNVGAQLETGYRIGSDAFSLTPYAAVRGQAFFSPAYTETVVVGTPDLALAYEANTTFTLRTEVGARMEHSIAFDSGASLAVHGSLAWVHEYWWNTDMTAAFAAAPGVTFMVAGAPPPPNSFIYSAGASIGFANGFSIGATFDGELAPGTRNYAVTGEIGFTW